MKVLYEKFLENCTDPIASVRQGGACSLGYLVKANKEFLDPTIKEGINSDPLVSNSVPPINFFSKFIPLTSLFVTVLKI